MEILWLVLQMQGYRTRLPSIHHRNCLGDDFNDLVFLIYCPEHRSSFYMEIIRKHFHIYLILPGSLTHCLLIPTT